MTKRDERRAAKLAKAAWSAELRAVARSKVPLSATEMTALFAMLDERLSDQGCDHSLKWVRAWLSDRSLDVAVVEQWLQNNGGFCDCEVLGNVEEAWRSSMRRYAYVGPDKIRKAIAGSKRGTAIEKAEDLAPFANGEPLTFVVDSEGILRVADRRSEHVACAGGASVLSAGELTAIRERGAVRVTEVSNQSTGYCPEPESWEAVAAALDRARVAHPGRFTFEAIFRRCVQCGERNLVKDACFECAICGAALPATWNF